MNIFDNGLVALIVAFLAMIRTLKGNIGTSTLRFTLCCLVPRLLHSPELACGRTASSGQLEAAGSTLCYSVPLMVKCISKASIFFCCMSIVELLSSCGGEFGSIWQSGVSPRLVSFLCSALVAVNALHRICRRPFGLPSKTSVWNILTRKDS